MSNADVGCKQRSYQHRAAGREHDLVAPVPVPGRVAPPATAHHPAAVVSSQRSALGALRRLAIGLAQLDEATRAGRAASPMLVLDVRSALTRAEAALEQADADPTWDEARAAHAELAPRARAALDAQAALVTPDARHAALAADVETMAGRVGLGRIDVRTDATARSITDAQEARGVALGEVVHLHPDALDRTDAIAHELVHLAQARLSPTGDDDRAAAEVEAAELAPQLAGGASIRPSRYIDLSRPAADTHADAVRLLRSAPDAVSRARKMADDATNAYEEIYLRYLANERDDVASFELVPKLASVGKTLAWARTEVLSDPTLPESRKELIPGLLQTIDAYAKQIILLEMQLRGASETAEVLGKSAPEPAKKDVKVSDGPLSGRDAQAYIAATPIVGDAIARGPFREQFGKIKVVFHDTQDSFAQAYVDTNGDAKATPEELRARASTVEGFTNPGNRIPHVLRPGAAPSTTIHEVLHAVGDPKVAIFALDEGLTEYATRMVCDHHGLPFGGVYPEQIALVEKLVAETSVEAVVELAFLSATSMQEVFGSKGEGTWAKFKKHTEDGNYLLAARALQGLREANEQRLAAEAEEMSHAAADRAAAAHAADPPVSDWPPEGMEAEGPILVGGSSTRLTVGVGAKQGVGKGWQASVPLKGGGTVVGTVTELYFERSVVQLRAEPDLDSSRKVYLWRSR